MSGPRSATVVFSWPRRQLTPCSVSSTTLPHPSGGGTPISLRSAFSSGVVSVAWRWMLRPGPRSSAAASCGCVRCTNSTIASHSSIASAATSASTWYGSPTASAASARWMASSCVIRRAQKPELRTPAHAHTRVSGPASRSVPTSISPVSASQASRAAGSPWGSEKPPASGILSSGTFSCARVRTMNSTQRNAPPICRTSCSSDHSGQVGTVADRSAASAASTSLS